MTTSPEPTVSDRLASKNKEDNEQKKSLATGFASAFRAHPQDIEIRKFAIDKAIYMTVNMDLLEITGEPGDLIVETASKIEEFIRNGKKEETK